MNRRLDRILSGLGVEPVLLEVGARPQPLDHWKPIASCSTYVAVDCDPQRLNRASLAAFRRAEVAAVLVDAAACERANFHLTKDRVYSSLLPVDPCIRETYVAPGVAPERRIESAVTTLEDVARRCELPSVDWIKLNVNGREMSILKGLGKAHTERLLAVETCLDFIQVFQGQDAPFSHTYPELVSAGFWLSWAHPWGLVRMRRESRERMRALDQRIDDDLLERRHGKSCGWMTATFLRTVNSMDGGDWSPRDYVVLWAFATIERQFGFAADVAFARERRFGADEASRMLIEDTRRALAGLRPSPLRSVLRQAVPARLRRRLRGFLLDS